MNRNDRRKNRARIAVEPPIMSSHERQRANRQLLVCGALVAVFIAVRFWHIADEASTDLIVFVPVGRQATTTEQWLKSLRASGFHVHVVQEDDLAGRRYRLHIPEEFAAETCAVTVNPTRYVLSGLVPPAAIQKMLRDQPLFQGLILADPPVGVVDSPRSDEPVREIWGFWSDGHRELFMRDSGGPSAKSPCPTGQSVPPADAVGNRVSGPKCAQEPRIGAV
jgi:hypothetical protein